MHGACRLALLDLKPPCWHMERLSRPHMSLELHAVCMAGLCDLYVLGSGEVFGLRLRSGTSWSQAQVSQNASSNHISAAQLPREQKTTVCKFLKSLKSHIRGKPGAK